MKKRKKKSWIKRATATGMAVCMTLTSSTPLLAEGVTADTEIQEITDEEFASGDSVTDSTETSNQTENIESGETGEQDASADFTDTEIQPEDTEPAETGSQPNGTESEEGEDQPDTIGSEDKTDSETEDSQEIHLSLELIAEDVGADAQGEKLTLDAADKLSEKLNVKKDKTIEVTDGEGLILLSNVNPEDYKDFTIELITTTGWDLTKSVTPNKISYSFQGLGSETDPYAGRLELDESTAAKQYSITTTKPLFQALSTKAILSGTIPFGISETASSTNKPLLADSLIAATDGGTENLKANIVLRDLNSDKISDAAIGGLIGTMKAGTRANITFENQFTKDLKVSGESHTGLFCNTMESGAALKATFTTAANAGKINVEADAENADAGGFVGRMETDASLTAAGNSVTQVSSVFGNAGGLVGSATDGKISVKEGGNLTFADMLTLKSASNKSDGGLIGEYTVTKGNEISYDLSGYKFNNIEVSGGGNAGGLFGVLRNNSTAKTMVSVSGTTAAPVKTAVTGAVTNFGGLIGNYQSDSMDNTLSIKGASNSLIQTVTTGGSKVNASYGGVVGVVSGSSYVEIENVSASTADMKSGNNASFGGLIGKIEDGILNAGSVTLATADSYDLAADDVEGRGGLVGHLVKGVVRLHGTTDLSGQKITTAYNHTGQIVGNNENGLVYALGDGNTSSDSQTGWKLTRYSGEDRSGSDIGNWGSVVRLGGKLTEGEDGVFSFDKMAHTVKINNGTGAGIKDENAFAAYALAFDLSKEGTGSAALSFNSTVDPAAKQTVTLSGDIDLTGTGILGIGKDSVEKNASAQKFQGTLNGNSYTITLDIGTAYGEGVSGAANAAGQLYARRKKSNDAHYSLALIPFSSDATIQDVTIAGTINCKVPKTVEQETKEESPAFVSAVVGLASGKTTFNNVTVNAAASVSQESEGAKELQVWQGGFVGQCEGNTLDFSNCTWGSNASLTDARSTDHQRIGGLAADVMGGCTVSVKDCALSGAVTSSAGSNTRVGGLIAVSRGDKNGKAQLSTINISDLTVNGERINAAAATKTSGGLLGYQWKNTNVVFAERTNSNGVNISGSTLNAVSQFGGLVYQATGYWKATAANSIVFANSTDNKKNTFKGKSSKDSPSGLLVGTGLVTKEYTENNETKTGVESALYLEVGTWGSASAAYEIGSGAVTLEINNSDYFDELVGITKYNDAGNNNAVVSLAVRDANGVARIDQNNNITTYTGQIDQKNYKNSQTRYYYNLDSYRKNNPELNLNSVDTPGNLVLWSAAQYAAPNIRGCFRIGERTDVTISGEINLTGYSYYPVTPLGAVNLGGSTNTSVTFDYDRMNATENENKQLSDSEHQHYLMQHGLFYNVSRNIKVNNTTFAGTVGKEESGTANTYTYNSGALIYGSVTGDPVYIVEISLNNVTLAGIRVTGVQNDAYAPLLINQLNQAVKLTVNNLSTGEGYTAGDGDNKTTTYAATSLIGKAGSETATKLTLFFSNIALDGRRSADTTKSTSASNNGKTTVEYHTTHTIFTKATLLDSFMYSSEGSGTYNFNTTDNKVTYGVELTNTDTGRNPDKQYQYYDDDTYISDESVQTATKEYVKSRYAATNFIRYVYTQQNTTASQYELDINQKTTGLLKGCGTYGDPYIIEDAHQLSSLAAYIQNPDSVSKFQAVFNQKVLEKKSQTADGYHTQKLNAEGDNATEGDILCTWENKTWTNTAQGKVDTETATQYLLNAYYKISKDLTISAGSFSGLGTLQQPFSGVIVGADKSIKVSVTGTNENKDSFGGLIAYSRGSVVKDLTVDYSQATITMQADSLPGTKKNPFFGGVVGYCMGGDTIIDNVSVNYAANSILFSGTYQQLIAAGGYVGLVGGATHVTEDSDYEKTGGGVVFRNMNNTTNSFKTACAEAGSANKTVNADGTADGKTTTAGGTCFYRNPYVGRVLDGYACAEKCTVDNTDKNYTIPTLEAGTDDLQVTDGGNSLNVTVTSAQDLWLLSAIVNSGAGAMDAAGNYTDVDGQVVDAYQYGKPRTGTYDGIGTKITDAASVLSDEAYWGGTASTAADAAKNRVSYLVKKYTIGTAAARLAGKSSSAATNIPVNLTFNANSIDMRSYGNGFRGIGSSYGENKKVKDQDCSISKVYRRNLLVNSINAGRTTDTAIKLDINQNDYKTEYENGSWRNQGAGLFVDFHFTEGCKVNHLGITGNVKVGLFDTNGNLTYVTKRTTEELIGVGGFAARTANSKGTVSFENFKLEDIQVYGGVMTGGAIGYIDGHDKEKRNVTFTNWTISSGNVSTWVYMNGSTGGLVGWNNGYGKLTITGSEDGSEKVNVNNFEVSTTAEIFEKKNNNNTTTSGSGAAGGLAGLCEYGTVNIKNVNATNLTVTGKNMRDVGGLIAAGRINGNSIDINNCLLDSIRVTVSNAQITKDNNVGGVIGYTQKLLKISKVTIKNNSYVSGQKFAGGFVGSAYNSVTIQNCEENSTNIQATLNWVGGFIGYVAANKIATFNNCQEENVNILGLYAGGLVGAIDGDITASNMKLVKVLTVGNQPNKGCAGLITGNTINLDITNYLNNNVKGYNILADSCKTGYNGSVKVEDLSNSGIQIKTDCGFWIGKNVGVKRNTTINLTAVAAKGEVFPQKDIGTQKGSATIIYADASADQTYKPEGTTDKPSSSAAPWLDVNPKSNVSFADGTVMTGNGAGTGTASNILSELKKDSPSSAYYWNLKDKKKELAKFLDKTNDAYVTTYMDEESKTTTVDEKVDFPVLVVNNTADVDAMLWNYIAAMTNVKDGTEARKQSKDIKATTYKWNQSNFAAQKNASLSVNSSSKKISIVPNAYDNQNSQFTLLDVTYANPTNGNAEPFHLYIPVLVKKVLYISFDAKFLAGTDYCAEDYPAKATKGHYATAGFDEPLTAYMEYSYEKETDWQSMLDNGENLLWYYDKILDLAAGGIADSGKTLLPGGTRLTLLDRQTKQYYTYTTKGQEKLHSFNLSQMQTPDGKAFTPVSICDLLDLTAKPVTEVTEGKTYYVEDTEADHANATVRIGTTYYRKASDEELKNATIAKYSIAVSEESKTEARTESYYLTIQIPKTDGYPVINNRLNYGTFSRKEGTLPAVIKSEADVSGSAYVVYNGVEQTFKISSSREHNGSVMGDMTMENGDSIIIKLESKLKLTEAGKDKFDKLGPAKFYHEFDVSMKKYLQEEAAKYDVIGTEMVDYTYTLSGIGLQYKKEDSINDAAGLETLTLKYGGKELKRALEQAKSDATAVTVTAEIRLTYAGADHFPVRNTSDEKDDNSGISPEGVSRIANTEVQLPITENKKPLDDKNRYYITNPSRATLTYYTVDGAGLGDTTQQLGINPSDETNPSDIIYTRADYNYSNVDEKVLQNASKIHYKLELFQKNVNGIYDETDPLAIGSYLQNITKDSKEQLNSKSSGQAYQWEENFKAGDTRSQTAGFRFTPLTGEAFEKAGYTYANYRVRLTVVLLDASEKELEGTKATDYIIYTNARICQEILGRS